jgi:hypothetical protein
MDPTKVESDKNSLSLNDEKVLLSEQAYGDPRDIDEGFLPPTEEEKQTLRRVPGAIPWTAFRE